MFEQVSAPRSNCSVIVGGRDSRIRRFAEEQNGGARDMLIQELAGFGVNVTNDKLPSSILSAILDGLKSGLPGDLTGLLKVEQTPVQQYSEGKRMSPARRREVLSKTIAGRQLLREESAKARSR